MSNVSRPTGKLPQNWNEYLKNSENKKELFEYLADALLQLDQDLHLVTNKGPIIKSHSANSSLREVPCGRMEEADGRMIWHVRDALLQGSPCLFAHLIRTF